MKPIHHSRRRQSRTSPAALPLAILGLALPAVTANPISGDLTVEGDIIVDNSTHEFKIRNGTHGADFWHDVSREWMWSHGPTPALEVMRLGPDNTLRIYDRNGSNSVP